MKTNKYLSAFLITTLLVFGLNGSLVAKVNDEDQLRNAYIEAHIPVFAPSNFMYLSQLEGGPLPMFNDYLGTLYISLTNPELNEKEYNPDTLWYSFLGYSNENSKVQLSVSWHTLFAWITGEDTMPLSDPIPLKPGIYEIKESAFGHNYWVIIEVKTVPLDIKTLASGYTRFDASYGPIDVYLVSIKFVSVDNRMIEAYGFYKYQLENLKN